MIIDIDQGNDLVGGFAVAFLRRVIITVGGVVQGVAAVGDHMFNSTVAESVMIPRPSEHIVKIEHGHIVAGITLQPIVHQPAIEGPGIGGKGPVLNRWRGDGDKELVRPGLKIGQQIMIDRLGVADTEVATALGEVIRLAMQVRIGEAGLEHDDPVFATRILFASCKGRMLPAFTIEGVEICLAFTAGKPPGPVRDVGAVANAVRPPAVIGVADKIVVLVKGLPQIAVAVRQPVLTTGVMDEHQLDGLVRRSGIIRLDPCWP